MNGVNNIINSSNKKYKYYENNSITTLEQTINKHFELYDNPKGMMDHKHYDTCLHGKRILYKLYFYYNSQLFV
jgi:hypothetical protein